MGADGKMDVQLDVSNGGRVSRLEVIEGPTGRRSRSEAEKARIAAESLLPQAQVATIARKYGVTRWQVYDWRRRLRQGRLALPDGTAAMFAPLMVDEPLEPQPAMWATAKLEIRIDDVVILTEVEADHLADVIRAVRALR